MRRNNSAFVTRASAVTSPPGGAPAPGSDAHAAPAFVHDVYVDHGRFDARVAKQFLYSPNVIAAFKQVRGKRVAQGMAAHVLDDTSGTRGLLDGPARKRRRRRGADELHP